MRKPAEKAARIIAKWLRILKKRPIVFAKGIMLEFHIVFIALFMGRPHVLNRTSRCRAWSLATLFLLGWATTFITPALASAGNLVNDPQGFRGIPWGSSLTELENLTLTDSGERVKRYDMKQEPLTLGEASVDSMRLYTIDGKFARVAIYYRGQSVHKLVLAYLESKFGPIDRAPGSMVRGLNQQYNWRGSETEINLTYQGQGERGFLFIESRTLAPRLTEALLDIGSSY